MSTRERPPDINELRTFCTAADSGSLGRAALRLEVSQPALSKRLASLGALAGLTDAYSGPLATYQRRFPRLTGLNQGFVAATDTVVRSFMGTFSALSERYGIYMVGSADVAPVRQIPERHWSWDSQLLPRASFGAHVPVTPSSVESLLSQRSVGPHIASYVQALPSFFATIRPPASASTAPPVALQVGVNPSRGCPLRSRTRAVSRCARSMP